MLASRERSSELNRGTNNRARRDRREEFEGPDIKPRKPSGDGEGESLPTAECTASRPRGQKMAKKWIPRESKLVDPLGHPPSRIGANPTRHSEDLHGRRQRFQRVVYLREAE